MTDWFEWNGKKCTEFGIHVSEHPPITLPAERSTFTNVPGRSGSLTVLEDKDVYDDMLLTCTCFIENTDRLPEIAAWLRGSGTVTFANRQGGFYHARVVNQIPFEKVLRGHPHRSFAVTFRCQPFFHLKADDIMVTAPVLADRRDGHRDHRHPQAGMLSGLHQQKRLHGWRLSENPGRGSVCQLDGRRGENRDCAELADAVSGGLLCLGMI